MNVDCAWRKPLNHEVAIWRSYKNIPTLDEQDVVQRVEHALIAMAVLVAIGAVVMVIGYLLALVLRFALSRRRD